MLVLVREREREREIPGFVKWVFGEEEKWSEEESIGE